MSNKIIFVIDRSGSMGGHEGETFPAFDDFVKELREESVTAEADVILFDDDVETKFRGRPLSEVPPIASFYGIRGGTNLWDAVHVAMNGTSQPQYMNQNVHLARLGVMPGMLGAGKTDARTMCVIITDGHDTGSRNREPAVAAQAQSLTKQGWVFVWIQIASGTPPSWAGERHSVDFKQLRGRMLELAGRTATYFKSTDRPLLPPPSG